MSLKKTYEYAAKVVRVIDGDTILMDVDLGFYTYVRMSCRLFGLNARELNDAGGREAKEYLASIFFAGTEVLVNSIKPDKYSGRFDGMVMLDGVNINQQMIDDGYAAVWDGKGTQPTPSWPIK